jgi:hypothetical protein
MPECVTCVSLHGPPGCPASSITADGDPICIFCIDQLLCPVQKRMLANARSPLHSPRRFAIAHLLQGERIPRAQAECEASAPAKPKTNDPAPTHSNGNAKHDGRRIGHHGSVVSARMLELRAARAAAAKPGSRNATPTKPKTSEPAHGNGAARSLGAAAAGSSQISKQNAHVANDSQEEKKMATTTTPAPTSTAPAARVCKIAGCKGQLGSQNQSGLCRKHRSHTAAAASPARSNGHANGNGHHAAKSNGSGKTNGREDRLAQSVIAQRVKALLRAVELPIDCVLEIIPDQDKKVFVENWLLAREGAA